MSTIAFPTSCTSSVIRVTWHCPCPALPSLPSNRLHHPLSLRTPKEYLDYHFQSLIASWVAHVRGHLANRRRYNLHLVFYERLVARPGQELARLARHLGLSLPLDTVETVARANDFDAISARQPHHTHKGAWGGWRDELTGFQIDLAGRTAGPLMELLGYPVDREASGVWSADRLSLSV